LVFIVFAKASSRRIVQNALEGLLS
jgi:hypothetical protein